eukprot:TRINITY_DN4935_c0_g1_i2.p1 TRINITY_DN4935_c0_g1~~TRINITY_DN4935_c0_g1_i2.p1  ORF type:complete len:1078 (+),score=157.09 TRINITY_DN4935_c0_g1_i2:34-3234(+)
MAAVSPHMHGPLINQPDFCDAEKSAKLATLQPGPRRQTEMPSSTLKQLHQAGDNIDADSDDDQKPSQREALSAKDEDYISRLFVTEQADWQQSISTTSVNVVLPSDKQLGLLIDDLPVEQVTREILAYPKVDIESTGLIASKCDGDQKSVSAFFDTRSGNYKLRVIRVNDACGPDALAYLRRVLFRLKQGIITGQTSLSIEFAKDRLYKFQYKQREHTGTLLHVAALHRDGHYLMDSLMDAKADPAEPCTFVAYERAAAAQALHLAAGVGNIQMLQLLVNSDGVDVNAKTKHGDRINYTPLHEAAYHSQEKAVALLLKSRACPNQTNIKQETALHLAVRADHPGLCRLLVSHKADLHTCTRKNETPLTLAILHSPSSLHVVTDKHLDEILRIAKAFPEENLAYKVLLSQSGKVRSSWVKSLCEEAKSEPKETLHKFLEFAEVSPQAAATLLTAMAMPPEVQHADKNPLPLRAKISGVMSRFHTDLQLAECWATDVLPWMDELCPGLKEQETMKDRQQWRRVHVKVVRLPGVVSLEFLQTLARQDQEHLFKSVVTLGVLNFCWFRVAKSSFICSGILKFVVLAFLTASVAHSEPSPTFQTIAWSLVAVVAHFELVNEIFELAHYLMQQQVYEYSLKNWKDWICIVLLVTVVYASAFSYDLRSQPELVAFLVLMRWTQLAWAFRAFEIIGPSILPIMLASFGPIQGILLLLMFGFFGFYTAFLALAGKKESVNAFDLLLNTVRLLLLGDGDGIDAVLTLGGSNDDEGAHPMGFVFLMMAIFVFSIILLNLFIAVYGEAYDLCQEQAWGTFLRERAEICLHAFVKPDWPPVWCKGLHIRHRKLVCSIVGGIGFIVWFLLLYFVSDLPPVIPTAFLTFCILVGDCILRQKPWHNGYNDGNPMSFHLWMCHASDFDESRFWPAAKSEQRKPHDVGIGVRGRHMELKQDFMLRQREMSAKLEYMQCKVDTSFRTMERSLTGLSRSMKQSDSRITRLECSLAKLAEGVSGTTKGSCLGTLAEAIPQQADKEGQLHDEVSRGENRDGVSQAGHGCPRGIISMLDRQPSVDAILE